MDMKSGRTWRQMLALMASGSGAGGAGCLGNSSESDSPEETQSTPTPEPTVPDVNCNPEDYPSLSNEPPKGAWSLPRGNQRRTGGNLAMDPLQLQDVDELQATELFSYSEVSLPVIADGVAYLTDNDFMSYAVDIETGETIWAVKTEANHRFPPVVTRDTVYFLGYEATFLALGRESGVPRWRMQLDVAEGSGRTPVVAGETLIVGHKTGIQDDLQGRYIGLDTRCGSKRWSVEFDNERPRGLATDGEMVYAATDHHLSAINPGDGTEHWRVRVTDSTLERPPALAGETVTLYNGDDLYALATEDGTERWNTRDRVTAKHPPTVTSDTVYVVESDTSHVLALDIETGEERWRYTDIPGEIHTPLTYLPGRLYGIETHSEVLVLDAETGTKHTDTEFPPIDARLSYDSISEIAITPAGIFIHGHPNEPAHGSEHVHRFY